jgi:hypothetical protein
MDVLIFSARFPMTSRVTNLIIPIIHFPEQWRRLYLSKWKILILLVAAEWK